VLSEISDDPQLIQALALGLGRPVRHDFVEASGGFVHEISKEPHHSQNFGGVWHSDGSYLAEPPSLIVLQAVITPSFGGDTIWACQVAAAASLGHAEQMRLSHLYARHAARVFAGYQGAEGRADGMQAFHPVLRWLADRRAPALFHSGPCLLDVEGLEAEDLERLAAIARSTLTFRHRWNDGDIVVWDNRSTIHRALNDYQGQRRLMRRAMVQPEAPIPVPAAR